MKKIIAIGAVLAMLATATPAGATWWNWGSDPSTTINVTVSNIASVVNDVETEAETGDNDAFGGSARNYVRGGSVDDTSAVGGDADVDTGDATAFSKVYNDVNYTKTRISVPCSDCDGDMTANVRVTNNATVVNYVETEAETGDNDADAGSAKNMIKSRSSSCGWWGFGGGVDDTSATGGDADVSTGDAYADSMVTNLVNTTITRIRR